MKQIHRLVAYTPDGPRIGDLPTPTDVGWSVPLNDLPGCTLNYRDNTVGAEILRSVVEVAVEYSQDKGQTWTEFPNGRFLRLARSQQLVGPEAVKGYTLPGYGWQLNKMRQMKTTELNADGKRAFNSQNAGQIMKVLLDETKARGVVPGMSYDFSTTHDSAGQPWSQIITIAYEPGLDLFTILNNLSQQGMVDWYFQGRTLRMFNADAALAVVRDIKLQPGEDISGLPVSGSFEDLVHTILVLGDGGQRLKIDDTTNAPTPWGKWEGFIGQGGVSDPGTMNLLGQSEMETSNHEKVQYTAEISVETTEFEPIVHYKMGDFVLIPDDVGGYSSFRIRAMNFTRDSSGKRSLGLIINDRFLEREIRNSRRTIGITGGASAGGSGTRPTPESGGRTPKTPNGIVVNSVAYTEVSGAPRAIMTVGWAAVTEDVSSISLPNVQYEVQYRVSPFPVWSYMGRTDQLSVSLSNLPQNHLYYVRVRAMSETGTPSAWSGEVSHSTLFDTVPPPKPSIPTATTSLGTAIVNYDWKDVQGNLMPLDTNRVELYQTGRATPLHTFSAPGSVVIGNLVVGTGYSWYLRPVDNSKNVGPLSDTVALTIKGVMDDPAVQEQIDEAVLASGASGNMLTYSSSIPPTDPAANENRKVGDTWFQNSSGVMIGQWTWMGTSWVSQTVGSQLIGNLDAGKITTGVLAADRIAVNSLSGDKITVGTIEATHLTADALNGKTIVGGTIATGTRTSATLGVGTWLSSAGVLSIKSQAGRTLLEVNPTSGDTIFAGGDVSIEADYGWGGYSMIVKYSDHLGHQEIRPLDYKFYNSNGHNTVAIESNYFADNRARLYVNGQISTTGPIFAEGGIVATGLNILADDGSRVSIGSHAFKTVYFAEPVPTVSNAAMHFQSTPYPGGPRVWSNGIESNDTSGGANMHVNASGTLMKSTSATRYKEGIEPVDLNESVLDLRPVSWYNKSALNRYAALIEDPENTDLADLVEGDEPLRRYVGLLAEDVEKSAPQFVEYNQITGEVDGVMYERLVVPLIPIVARLRDRVAELERVVGEMQSTG